MNLFFFKYFENLHKLGGISAALDYHLKVNKSFHSVNNNAIVTIFQRMIWLHYFEIF